MVRPVFHSINALSRGRGIVLHVKEWIDCTELSLKNSNEQVESLWIKIRGQANKGDIMVGVYYRPPDQGKPVDEAFLLLVREASHVSDPAAGLQSPRHLLEKQHSKL